MAIASENSLTIIVRTWTVMIIFCYVSGATGSCLSYGHSCWGAHGKRSERTDTNAYLVPAKTMTNYIQQDVPSSAIEQWILSRFIGGRFAKPLPNEYRTRWNGRSKVKELVPQHWSDEHKMHLTTDESVRDQHFSHNAEQGNRRNIMDMEESVQNENDERKENPEILLISGNEDSEHDSNPQNVELLKFLGNGNDYFK